MALVRHLHNYSFYSLVLYTHSAKNAAQLAIAFENKIPHSAYTQRFTGRLRKRSILFIESAELLSCDRKSTYTYMCFTLVTSDCE